MSDLEDGQGGPIGEIVPLAEEALAEVLSALTVAGLPDQKIAVVGLHADLASPITQPPEVSGIVYPFLQRC
eukprot:2620862-Pyramimonas_sp.AAC.1